MNKGEVMHYADEAGRWVAVRVIVPLGQGAGQILASFYRLCDGKRVLLLRDATLMEVQG